MQTDIIDFFYKIFQLFRMIPLRVLLPKQTAKQWKKRMNSSPNERERRSVIRRETLRDEVLNTRIQFES